MQKDINSRDNEKIRYNIVQTHDVQYTNAAQAFAQF